MTLELLSNAGEVAIRERSEWPFYLLVHCDVYPISAMALQFVTEHLRTVLVSREITAEVDALS
jgi:hypothetical protein